MKIIALMVMACATAIKQPSTFEREIQKNRHETIKLLKERLEVIESDLIDVDYLIDSSSSSDSIKQLNSTLFQDKDLVVNVLKKMMKDNE